MRICHVSPHLPPDQAANALLPAHLGTWSTAAGHSVSFVTQPAAQSSTPSTPGTLSVLAGPVARIRPRSASPLARALRVDALQRARSIVAALDEAASHSDLLHLHSNGLIVEVAAAWAARRAKPFVLTLYGTEIWHYRRRWLIDPFTRAYHGASTVAFYSRKLLERAVELGLHRPHLEVVYPPVATSFQVATDAQREAWRRELGIAEPRVILNVKRLHPLAAQEDLVAAFATLARGRDDVRLVICGTGSVLADLQRQAQAAGVSSKITFAGLVGNDLVARYAAIADVFALPSKLEALPTVAVEALATGTPVVSADHPGGVELHGLFGGDVEVVKRGDVPELAAALARYVDRPRRTAASTAALVRRHFSREAVESAYAKIYERSQRGKLRTENFEVRT